MTDQLTATSQLQQQLQNAVRCLESQGDQPYTYIRDHAPDTPLHLKKRASDQQNTLPLQTIDPRATARVRGMKGVCRFRHAYVQESCCRIRD